VHAEGERYVEIVRMGGGGKAGAGGDVRGGGVRMVFSVVAEEESFSPSCFHF